MTRKGDWIQRVLNTQTAGGECSVNWMESDVVHRKYEALIFRMWGAISTVTSKGVIVPAATGSLLPKIPKTVNELTCSPYHRQT
jgi:hypothetical protein